MIVYFIPVVFAGLIAWVSNYAPLPLLPPYDYTSIVVNPKLGQVGPLIGPLERNTILGDANHLFQDRIVGPGHSIT